MILMHRAVQNFSAPPVPLTKVALNGSSYEGANAAGSCVPTHGRRISSQQLSVCFKNGPARAKCKAQVPRSQVYTYASRPRWLDVWPACSSGSTIRQTYSGHALHRCFFQMLGQCAAERNASHSLQRYSFETAQTTCSLRSHAC